MPSNLSKEEAYFLELLRRSLTEKDCGEKPDGNDIDTDKVLSLARGHKVMSLLYEELMQLPLPEEQKTLVESTSRTVVAQNFRLLFLDKYITEKLAEADIPVAVLKGMATAAYYPEPLYRKSGDVDLLLLDGNKLEQAKNRLIGLGFSVAETQPSLHHVVFDTGDGIEIELHTELAEPFDNRDMNVYMEKQAKLCKEHIIKQEFFGVRLPVLDTAYHAFELLLHMLQHFLRSGFGIKLLCDWVVFWNRELDENEQKKYVELVSACGLKGFSDQVTAVCTKYLGLDAGRAAFMDASAEETEIFIREILEAEEFGKSSAERMVALRSGRLGDYVREFHHQMHLNYPRAGKCFLLWPFLWIATLVQFLHNNRRLKRPSASAILKKAGERGKMMENLHLFEKEK